MEKSKALNKVAALCAMSEQCETDIRQKLLKWGVEETVADEILDVLIQEGYLSDQRYARAFAHDHIRYDHWGRMKIAYMLRQKRVRTEAIEDALRAIDDEWAEEYHEGLMRTLGQIPDDFSLRQKIMRRAASRGFLTEEIMAVLEE